MAGFPISEEYLSMSPGYGVERNRFGGLKHEVLYVPLSECKIIFTDVGGNPVLPGHQQGEGLTFDVGDYIRCSGFLIEHPDIDPQLVARCSLEMDYESNEIARLRIEVRVPKNDPEKED